MTRVLIAGVSTRAAVASAVRAGFEVVSVDAFADRDQPAQAVVRRVARFTPAAAADAARDVRCVAAVYLSGFENHPGAVARLARGRALWGNAPDVLARVRDPRELARGLAARGITAPDFRLKPEATNRLKPEVTNRLKPEATNRLKPEVTNRLKPEVSKNEAVASGFSRKTGWLLKPFASGGGHGVREWHEGMRVPARSYLQEHVEGVPGSVVFVAAGGRAIVLGVTRQLIGDAAFGSGGFRYCGSIVEPVDAARLAAAEALASAVAAEFDLVGVNGVDVIDRQRTLVPVEVNPRWCASMELVERATGVSVFAAHAAACARQELPPAIHKAAGAIGKAVVFARADVRMPDTTPWLDDATVADVPHTGEHIAAGRPICTVFAQAPTASGCYGALVDRAAAIHACVEQGAQVLA